jgi:hypothetical protein
MRMCGLLAGAGAGRSLSRQMMPCYEAVAAETSTLDLISFDTGGPQVLLDWLGVTDPVAEQLIWL